MEFMANPQPKPEVIELYDRATYFRGRYISGYAQCEYLLADLSLRVDNRFRYALDKRVKAANLMAEQKGRLNAYADDFVPLISHIHTYSDRRHWLVHGFMTVITDPKGMNLIELRRYELEAGEAKPSDLRWIVTLGDLQDAAEAITMYAQAFVVLHSRIYKDLKLD